MLAWFSAFREHGAPTFYGEQRTPVTIDTQIASLFIAFLIPSVAFLIILPGVRKGKITSSFVFYISIFVGATLAVSLYHPCWHRGEMDISASYKAFSKTKLDAHILIRVGLAYMNITLTSLDKNSTDYMHYNERFSFTEIKEMEQELGKALRKGLPYPILKVIEYLSAEGFAWGRQYRVAGYYTKCFMLMAGISWLITVFCLCLVPNLFPKSLFWTGLLIAAGDAIFFWQLPKNMVIHFPSERESIPLKFRPSICFQATCAAALLCLVLGSVLWWAEANQIHQLDTIFTSRRNVEDSVVERKSKSKAMISCEVRPLSLPQFS